MSGHHKFLKLTEGFSPQQQAEISLQTASLRKEMALAELRQAFQLAQSELADQLQIQQPDVLSIEQRTELYISHLRQAIETMGGELEIVARFSDAEVKITNFGQLHPPNRKVSRNDSFASVRRFKLHPQFPQRLPLTALPVLQSSANCL